MMNKLFTVGHSNHTIKYFNRLLNMHSIEIVFDVRSHPYSKFNPQYNKETLEKSLQDQGIQYVFCGDELGARSKNPMCYNEKGQVQFDRLAKEPLFMQGILRIKAWIGENKIALMCAEKDPITCHRMILICRKLKQTLQISHILADGSIEMNEVAEKRLMKQHNLAPDMIMTEDECIEDAYNFQSNKIAYIQYNKAVGI